MSLCGLPSAGSAPITNVSPGCGSRQITKPGTAGPTPTTRESSGTIAPTQPLSSKTPIQTARRQSLKVRCRVLLEEVIRCRRSCEYVTLLLLVPLRRPPRSGRPRQEDRLVPVLAPLAGPVDPLEGALRLRSCPPSRAGSAGPPRRSSASPPPAAHPGCRPRTFRRSRPHPRPPAKLCNDRPPVVGNARPTDPFASSML